MKRMIFSPAIVLVAVSLFTPTGLTDAPAAMIRAQEDYTVSLALKFRKKKQNSLQRAIAILDYGPNGYASGFIVGDGLIMTAYHVVSGDLSSQESGAGIRTEGSTRSQRLRGRLSGDRPQCGC